MAKDVRLRVGARPAGVIGVMRSLAMEDGNQIYRVITANRLRDGAVVYLTGAESGLGWSTDIGDAAVFDDSQVEHTLRRAEKDVAANIVVQPYAIEIIDRHKVLGSRETIRASGGPTIKYGSEALAPPEPDYSI